MPTRIVLPTGIVRKLEYSNTSRKKKIVISLPVYARELDKINDLFLQDHNDPIVVDYRGVDYILVGYKRINSNTNPRTELTMYKEYDK